MSKLNHTCKVCGKKYYACDSCDEKTVFHWRSVACSHECFIKYMDSVDKVRNPIEQIKNDDIVDEVTVNKKVKK